jgi:hypothetical protein
MAASCGEGLEVETVDGEYVVGNFFSVLGVKPAARVDRSPWTAADALAGLLADCKMLSVR